MAKTDVETKGIATAAVKAVETKAPPIASRDSILNFVDFQTRYVEVPEWDGMRVKIRSMNAHERDQLEAPMVDSIAAQTSATNGKPAESAPTIQVASQFVNFRARVVALCVINEDGSNMFTVEDAEALGRKHAGAISRLADAIIELGGINQEDAAELVKS